MKPRQKPNSDANYPLRKSLYFFPSALTEENKETHRHGPKNQPKKTTVEEVNPIATAENTSILT